MKHQGCLYLRRQSRCSIPGCSSLHVKHPRARRIHRSTNVCECATESTCIVKKKKKKKKYLYEWVNEASCIKSFEFSNTVDTRYIRTTPCTVDFYCSVLVTVRLSKKRHVKGKRCRALLLCTAATSVKFKHNFIVLKYFFVLFAVSLL